MKRAIHAILMAAVLAAPALTFAQSNNGPITRAQVKAELVQIEDAGYHPAQKGLHYPDDIQAAEAKLNARAQSQSQANTAYGGVTNSTAGTGTTVNAQSDSN
jgi:flagellar motor protein MotB